MGFFKKHLFKYNKDYQMAWVISLLIGVEGLVMALICLREANLRMVLISLSYALAMLGTFVYINATKKLTPFYVAVYIIAFFLTIDFLIDGGSEGFGIIWMTIIPLFSVYVLPYRSFFIMNFGVLLILILGMWTPLNAFVYDFTFTFETRFPIVYIVDLLFAAFLKHRILLTEEELRVQKDLLATEIQQAALIQKNFFNQSFSHFSDWEIACRCIPMAGVSGDLYDFYPSKEDGIDSLTGAGVFDISGHGISSGIITLLAKNIIWHEFYENGDIPLKEIVGKISDRFIEEKGGIDNYITGILLRCKGGNIELVNSGHQKPLLYRTKGNVIDFIDNAPEAFGAIGISNFPSTFDSMTFEMQSGDELILYTDGIVDCENEDKESFGYDRLKEVFKKSAGFTAEEQLELLYNTLAAFAGTATPEDDKTLVILRKK